MAAPELMWSPRDDRTNMDDFRDIVNKRYDTNLCTCMRQHVNLHILTIIIPGCIEATSLTDGGPNNYDFLAHYAIQQVVCSIV